MPDLSDIRLDRLAEQTQAALLKLHLMVTAQTHRLLSDYAAGVRELLLDAADEDGNIGAVGGLSVLAEATSRWPETFQAWRAMLATARWEAGAIVFGRFAREHQGIMSIAERELAEQTLEDFSPVFDPQLQALLDAAAQRMYSDGFNLSDRIWRLDRDSLEGIRQRLLAGMAEGDSAWNIAQELEAYLGADQDCPRWTSTRLFKLTPSERAVSRRGLKSRVKGSPCESKGVAYNALRLARNEIQIAHHAAHRDLMSRTPWIEKEQIRLSPDHPDIGCECEDIVAGGEDGEGIYPVGQILLPIHVQCLPEGRQVRTSAGDVPIEGIETGDVVLTHKGRFRTVTRTFVRWHEGDLVKITTQGGREIVVTPDHPVLANGTWKAAGTLKVRDALLAPPIDGVEGDPQGTDGNQCDRYV